MGQRLEVPADDPLLLLAPLPSARCRRVHGAPLALQGIIEDRHQSLQRALRGLRDTLVQGQHEVPHLGCLRFVAHPLPLVDGVAWRDLGQHAAGALGLLACVRHARADRLKA